LKFITESRLANHTAELVSLQGRAEELDRADRVTSNIAYLDMRLKYRTYLESRTRDIFHCIETEAKRSAALKHRTESICKKASAIKTRAQDTADYEQLQILAGGTGSWAIQALRKLKQQ
jgi:hypothetical protein